MKQSFRKALKIFKYLFIIFTVIYWIWMPIDDYPLIEKYGLDIEGILIWAAWYLVFLIGGSFYYWLPISAVIVVYHKVISRRQKSQR